MNIGIIGSGNIGGTLGKAWSKKGYQIRFGSRDPHADKIQKLLKECGGNAEAGNMKEAIAFGEVILLAVPGTEIERVLAEAGDFQGKVLINATMLFDGRSAAAEVLRLAHNARVVRAFNTLLWETLANPQYGTVNATMFINGEDVEAKAVVSRLSQDVGLDAMDGGSTDDSLKIESAFGMMWGILSPHFGRNYTLKVLRRDS